MRLQCLTYLQMAGGRSTANMVENDGLQKSLMFQCMLTHHLPFPNLVPCWTYCAFHLRSRTPSCWEFTIVLVGNIYILVVPWLIRG